MKTISQIKERIAAWLSSKSQERQGGFTLPEVIVSFAVLAMVITSSTGILVTVIRTNSDNVSSLIADGLAQEGLDAVRFVRDSNNVLGLKFDGSVKSDANKFIWGGSALYDSVGGVKYFTPEIKIIDQVAGLNCKTSKNFDKECLPVQLKLITDVLDPLSLNTSDKTVVYKKTTVEGSESTDNGLIYFQNETASTDSTMSQTAFHRFIRIEPLKREGSAEYDKLRISSVVSWFGQSGQNREVILTTELTDWK